VALFVGSLTRPSSSTAGTTTTPLTGAMINFVGVGTDLGSATNSITVTGTISPSITQVNNYVAGVNTGPALHPALCHGDGDGSE